MKERVLVFGSSGLIGSRVCELLSDRLDLIVPSHWQVDVTNLSQLRDCIKSFNPDQILNCSGFTAVDDAEKKVRLTSTLNHYAPLWMAQVARSLPKDVPMHHLSTDYVFDGTCQDQPYKEEDQPHPLAVYADSKWRGEEAVLQISTLNSVLRVIMPYRPLYAKKSDLARLSVEKLQKGERLQAVVDQSINPIFVDDVVWAIWAILQKRAQGIYHLGAVDYTTPYDFINKIVRLFSLDEGLVIPTSFGEFSQTRLAKRPQHSWLDTQKFREEFGGEILHTVDEGLSLFKNQIGGAV